MAEGNRAAQIIEVATRLFARHGYDGVSVRDICAELSVNSSIISYHFGGKSGLYLEVLRQQLAAYGRMLDEVASRELDPSAELAALCEARRRMETSQPFYSAIIGREMGARGPEYLQAVAEFETRYGRRLTELIRRGQRQGRFKSHPRAEHLALAFSHLLNGSGAAVGVGFTVDDYFETVKSIMIDGPTVSPDEETHRAIGKQSAKPRGTLGR
jgi:Transcriptional regulator